MAVKIRLRRMGTRGKPFYRMVVTDERSPRNGRFIEALGYYNPCCEPPVIKIDAEKVTLWLSRGAQPSDTVAALLKKESLIGKKEAAVEKKAAKVEKVVVEESAPSADEPEVKKAPARKKQIKAAEKEEAAPVEASDSAEAASDEKAVEAVTEKAAPAEETAPEKDAGAEEEAPAEAAAEEVQATTETEAEVEEQPSEKQE